MCKIWIQPSSLRNVVAAMALVAGLGHATAQDYPNRPITLVGPFRPGGSTTIVARIVSDKMSEALGQSIVIDNRGGAGGTVSSRAVSKSAPDGYTILLGYTGTLAIGPTLYGNVGYDPRKDFEAIGRIGTAPNTLVVHPSLPVHSVAELIAYGKANPGKLNYGSARIRTLHPLFRHYLATPPRLTPPPPPTSPARDPAPPSPTSSAATFRWRSRRFRRRTRTPRPASCACWQ